MLVYVILPELFGVEKIARSSGISFAVYGVSGLLSPPFAGRKIIYDVYYQNGITYRQVGFDET